MKVVLKKTITEKIYDAVQDTLSKGKDIDYIEVTQEEYNEFEKIMKNNGWQAAKYTVRGYPLRII